MALDGEATALPEIDPRARRARGRYGFGRVDMIENRRVGIKSRELYEVPGALSIIAAHRALEDLTLERDLAHHKPGWSSAGPTWSTTGSGSARCAQAIDA